MRLSGVQDDTAALANVAWAVPRLTGGPGPELDLSAFLDRRDPETMEHQVETVDDGARRARGPDGRKTGHTRTADQQFGRGTLSAAAYTAAA
jgi:hypothetical protein